MSPSARRAAAPPPHAGGSALLITLFFVALLTILIIGFLESMELETASARSHLDGVVAQLYAKMAADTALARLSSAIGATNQFWASQPGRLYSATVGSASAPVPLDLSSGASSSASDDAVVDLNPTMLRNATENLVADTNLPMRVAWIYQQADGTLSTNQPPFPKENPAVGRFAYWVDDESTKINVNTAWGRAGNTNVPADPSRVGLAVLDGGGGDAADAAAIHAYVAGRHFNSLEELQRATGTNSPAVGRKFSLTHYSHSPDLNMFGEPRILLTTQKRYADAMGRTNFLDILKVPNADPGGLAAVDPAKAAGVVSNLVAELSRTDWPLLPGSNFAGKYSRDTDVTSIALNIVDWVRGAESTNNFVEPLRGSTAGGSFQMKANSVGVYDSGERIPAGRRPCIVEFGAYVPAAPGPGGTWPVKVKTKVYFPPLYNLSGTPAVNLVNDYIYYFTIAWYDHSTLIDKGSSSSPIQSGELSSPSLVPGSCVTLTRTYNLASPTRPTILHLQPTLMANSGVTGGGSRFDISICDVNFLSYPVDAAAVAEADIQSCRVKDDPFTNQYGGGGGILTSGSNWVLGPNTFGSSAFVGGAPALGQASGATPQQDADASGKITGVSVVGPAPAGSAGNPLGRVLSVAELGFVHTGMYSGRGAATPWRTLRLQPSQDAATVLPDWAMLDLFSVPLPAAASADAPYVLPQASSNAPSVGGRVNLNATVLPFVDGASATFVRILPLQSVLLGATGAAALTFADVQSISTNIAQGVLATGSNPGRAFGGGVLYTPAGICEVKGVADAGEASEALLRQVVDLCATRGNVFSIYAVGQSLKQDPSGTLHVLGEQRGQEMVERIVSSDGAVRFQKVYSQDFTP